MHIGIIGLGRMGYHMAERLLKAKHKVTGYNRSDEPTRKLARKQGAIGAYSIEELVSSLPKPRIIWIMVPHKAVDQVLSQLSDHLQTGDIIIDGGNSNYKETLRRGDLLEKRGVHYIDCGVSGGLVGALEGYCLMYGGNAGACKKLQPIFKALAKKGGHGRVGERGAGHYVKMIHNGIEYGMMAAIAEGLEIIASGKYKDTNIKALCDIWNHGSIIESFLLRMMRDGLNAHPQLKDIKPYIAESGEGRWTVQEAMRCNVPSYVLSAALFGRWRSQQKNSYSARAQAVMREQFGGHTIKKKK